MYIRKILQELGFIKKQVNVPENGNDAYEQGYALKDNPFSTRSAQHSIWRDDWLFNEELVPKRNKSGF